MAPPAGSSSDDDPAPLARPAADHSAPTPAGYLAGGALTVVLFGAVVGVGLAATMLVEGQTGLVGAIAAALTYGFTAGVVAAVAAAVVGIPLSMVAHAALRGVRAQAVHAATFGLVGALTAVALLFLFGFLDRQPLAWFLIAAGGACTALSRFVVGRRQGLRTRNPAAVAVGADQDPTSTP